MSRAYKVVDGTIENVGDRIIMDYRSYGCHGDVGSKITQDVRDKLTTPLMQSLGFSDTVLTQEIGGIAVSDDAGIRSVLSSLENIGVWCGFDFRGTYPSDDEAIEYLKSRKDKIVKTCYAEKRDAEDVLRREHSVYICTSFIQFRDTHGVREAFETNTPCGALFGLKPSRFLSRYIEPLVPGITEKYALAFSKKHDLKVHLTIDPNIMINCTESATFSSCYSHDGEYHYSAHRYATAQQTMMAVIFDSEGYIMYRNWVFCNEDRTGVINVQHYSSIGGYNIAEETHKVVNEYLLQADTLYEIPHDNHVIGIRDSSGASYLDGWDVTSNDPAFLRWNDVGSNPILGTAYDLNDGCITGYQCLESSYCECCDERYNEDETRYIPSYGTVCDCCINNDFVWSDSEDEYIHCDNAVTTAHGDVYHCNVVGDNHGQCPVDGEWYTFDDMQEAYDTGSLCYTGNLHYCDELERYYEDRDAMQEALDELDEDTEEV